MGRGALLDQVIYGCIVILHSSIFMRCFQYTYPHIHIYSGLNIAFHETLKTGFFESWPIYKVQFEPYCIKWEADFRFHSPEHEVLKDESM